MKIYLVPKKFQNRRSRRKSLRRSRRFAGRTLKGAARAPYLKRRSRKSPVRLKRIKRSRLKRTRQIRKNPRYRYPASAWRPLPYSPISMTKTRKKGRNPDYGADPIGDGTFRMIPSGDIVSYEEMKRRRTLPQRPSGPLIFGKTHEELAMMQGGLHTLDSTRAKKPKKSKNPSKKRRQGRRK